MSEKEKKRMWPQSSLAAMGSFTLGARGAGEGGVGAPLHPDPCLSCAVASARGAGKGTDLGEPLPCLAE